MENEILVDTSVIIEHLKLKKKIQLYCIDYR